MPQPMPEDRSHGMQDVNRPSLGLAHLLALVLRTLLLGGVWWTLTDGSAGWAFGLVLALLAAALSLLYTPPALSMLRVHRLPGFVAYFLLQSLRAGWDVARRILHPGLPLDPGLLRVPLYLPAGAPTWGLMVVISLLPGTLSVHLDGTELELHCLDAGADVLADVRAAEAQLARLFGHTPAGPTELRR